MPGFSSRLLESPSSDISTGIICSKREYGPPGLNSANSESVLSPINLTFPVKTQLG